MTATLRAEAPSERSAGPRPIIFDTDAAVFNDDGAALTMLLQRPDLVQILGVTVVAGNHPVAQGAEHLLHVLELLGRTDVPLFLGARSPLVNSRERARIQEERWGKIAFKGAFAAPDTVEPPFGGKLATVRPREENAVSFIIRTLEESPGEVTFFAVGPMTNLAIVLRLRPDLSTKIASLVFMGGNARVAGNVTPYAEFNFWFDPEAAHIVLESEIPEKLMFGLDITNRAPLTRERFDRVRRGETRITELYAHDLGHGWPGFFENPEATAYVWDCVAAAYLLDPGLVTASERLPIEVITGFGPAYGGTFVRPGGGGESDRQVQVMLDLDVDRFFEMYEDLLTRPLPAPKGSD